MDIGLNVEQHTTSFIFEKVKKNLKQHKSNGHFKTSNDFEYTMLESSLCKTLYPTHSQVPSLKLQVLKTVVKTLRYNEKFIDQLCQPMSLPLELQTSLLFIIFFEGKPRYCSYEGKFDQDCQCEDTDDEEFDD